MIKKPKQKRSRLCYNKLQIPVQRSLARYADWLKDFKQGPTGEERTVYGIYGISESNLAECEKGVKSAVALTPALQPIDGVAVSRCCRGVG